MKYTGSYAIWRIKAEHIREDERFALVMDRALKKVKIVLIYFSLSKNLELDAALCRVHKGITLFGWISGLMLQKGEIVENGTSQAAIYTLNLEILH